MHFLDHLERRFGRFAIPGLTRYVVALNALVVLLVWINPNYVGELNLDRQAILHGEIWRLVSWIFIPTTFKFMWVLLYLVSLWSIGDMLESAWGTFRVNAYYFTGMLFNTLSVFIFGVPDGNLLLNLSLLLALGTVIPNHQILLLVFPVKVKWAALFSLAMVCGVYILQTGLSLITLFVGIYLLFSLSNYLLFFGPALVRNWRDKQKVLERRARFETAKIPEDATLHRCFQCGKTEASHPNMDFRVAEDGHEYCSEHLKR